MSDRAAAIAAWYRAVRPEAAEVAVALGRPLSQGHSNEVVVADVALRVDGEARTESIVVRLPPAGPPLFPDRDLAAEAAAQDLAHHAGVPVPRPLFVETDPAWLGAPFLVMPLVDGRHPGEVPALTGWLLELPEPQQRQVQTSMLDALAALHRAPWQGTAVEEVVRRPASAIDEVRWWEEYAVWGCEGLGPGPLLEVLGWCRDHAPAETAPASALWGDVRLGNVVVADDLGVAALLDWEMTTIGPAESDVAWFTALSAMTDRFVGSSVPGFLDHDGIVTHVESRLGRSLRDLAWHETFAVARAAAAHLRTRVVAALGGGGPLPDPARDGVVQYAAALIA